MTLNKISFLLLIPLIFTLAEYIVEKGRIPSDRRITKFLEEESFLNSNVKRVGSAIKSIINSPQLGNICFGSDHYLFYCPKNDGNPIDDLYSINDLSDRKFSMPFSRMLMNHKKRVFYLTIPNKSRYFFQKLFLDGLVKPNKSPPWKAINEKDLINPDQYFSVGKILEIFDKHEENYYHKQDTHWTQLGAYKLIQNLNLKEVSEELIFNAFTYQEPDMILILRNLGRDLKSIDKKYSVQNSAVVKTGDSNKILIYKNSKKKNKVLILGDSNRSYFSPVIANYFAESHEIHFKNVNKHKINLSEYKYIFVIQVERYLEKQFNR